MKKILAGFSFILLFTFLNFFFPQKVVLAQGTTGDPICGGLDLYQGHVTYCNWTSIGFEVAEGFVGCPFSNACIVGDIYQGCAGVNLSSCDIEQYDQTACEGTANTDLTWNAQTCAIQQNGCFVPYPGINGGGVCVPGADQDYTCTNPPPSGRCNTNTGELCFNSPEAAGFPPMSQVGILDKYLQYCDCTDIASNNNDYLCYFDSAESLEAARTKYQDDQRAWGDSWCPVCPFGYDVQESTRDCRSPSGPVPIERYEVCESGEYCELSGVGRCQESSFGCRFEGNINSANNVCLDPIPFTCNIQNNQYCCPDSTSCNQAGGSEATCIGAGVITGNLGDCDANFPGFPITCNDVINLGTRVNYCCKTSTACIQKGGETRNAPPFGGACRINGAWEGIDTAIGCIPYGAVTNTTSFFLKWAMGVGGAIAIFFIIVASLQIIMSSGNPDRLQSGKDLLTSSITGLLMIIFSVFILRVIGVNILGIF